MVPAAFVVLDALPLTPNGKVDRQAPCRAPAGEACGADAATWRRATPVEEVLAAIWAEVLGVERVGASDDFFELAATRCSPPRWSSRVRAAFGVELPLRGAVRGADGGRPGRAASRRRGARARAPAAPPLVPVARATAPLPLSFAQERLWFLDQLEPGSAAYNIPRGAAAARARSTSPALAARLGEVVRRHEALRTTFAAVDGRAACR